MNVHLKQRFLQAGREFTEVDWSTVLDGFRDPSFSYLNWENETKIDFLFVSPDAVSFAEFCHEYTGGAHGNLCVSGRNFISDHDGFRELVLTDLFEGDTNWQRSLLRACLRDLHHQGASRVGESWFDDPIESGFSIEDLQSFTLSAGGNAVLLFTLSHGLLCRGALLGSRPLFGDDRFRVRQESAALLRERNVHESSEVGHPESGELTRPSVGPLLLHLMDLRNCSICSSLR